MRIREDIRTVFAKDPAARSVPEVLLCYPGLHALWVHRFAHVLWEHRFFLAARCISHLARMFTGIEIHPGATIGRRVFIDHGAGVVIGETASVGDDVLIYMGVVLGGTSLAKGKRHPTVEDGAVLGSGAMVLGPITVGREAKVGAGSVVVRPVPPGATVVGVPARIAGPRSGASSDRLDHGDLPDPALRVISRLLEDQNRLENRLAALERRAGSPAESTELHPGISHTEVWAALRQVIDPEVGTDIVTLGLVKEVVVIGASVRVDLVLTTPSCPLVSHLAGQARAQVMSVEGVAAAEVRVLDEPWDWGRYEGDGKKQSYRKEDLNHAECTRA
ncbi:serine O-acetyltransferase [Methanofollis aquaemaris]|uniref:Serine acetyltransferase n=1 Tax=Methanofollis aquaemaris TaxID=126734 RepID=A0A8A3S2L2_9EURY|nr:serine O-acetyltransferase [Methanofollis aquaemaris]QSZ66183.1 serine O-acetyltransferase [Methanofollis aquaemaris]